MELKKKIIDLIDFMWLSVNEWIIDELSMNYWWINNGLKCFNPNTVRRSSTNSFKTKIEFINNSSN